MEHVHANEVILTCGYSTTVLEFLKEVARRSEGLGFRVQFRVYRVLGLGFRV
jgi:translation initiation factor 2B subunit (eIF-2B alpha/beta/delta family)